MLKIWIINCGSTFLIHDVSWLKRGTYLHDNIALSATRCTMQYAGQNQFPRRPECAIKTVVNVIHGNLKHPLV